MDVDKPSTFTVPRRTQTHVRSDSLDARTSRHAGECKFASETDAAVLKIVLKVNEGAGGSYHWVECGRLAGSALRRERRVTTNSVPRLAYGTL